MTQATVLETCRVVWWNGYVRGRFQAVVGDPPRVAAESSPIRRRGAVPDRTEEARAALDEVTRELLAAGWTEAESDGDEWYELAFARESTAVLPEPERLDVVRAPDDDTHDVVEALRDEIERTKAAAERERRARLELEAASRARPAAVTAVRPVAPPRSGPIAVAVYVLVVVAVAAAFAVASRSTYATIVAALTAAALCLGADSWRVARRRW
ncbi:MAG TPA: hypothetical protein VI408_03975 [Gaiellaceae bacterium]